MASRKLLTALACAVAQLAQLTQTAAAAPSDVFFVHLNGVQGINAGRAGTQGDLWFARNPNVVGHVSSTGVLTNVVVPDAQRLSLIAPASSSAAWVVDGLGASISLIAAGRAGKPVALPPQAGRPSTSPHAIPSTRGSHGASPTSWCSRR